MDTSTLAFRLETDRKQWLIDHNILTTMVLSDPLPAGRVPLVHLFGQAPDNQESVISVGAELWRSGRVRWIGIPLQEAGFGYPGFDVWYHLLSEQGVSDAAVIPIAITEQPNTLTEAQALVRYCRSRPIESILICAPAWHQLRAFMSVVSIAAEQYLQFRVYNAPGIPLNWWKGPITHSQGRSIARRADIITEARDAIATYQRQGDLVPFRTMYQYLVNRDNPS